MSCFILGINEKLLLLKFRYLNHQKKFKQLLYILCFWLTTENTIILAVQLGISWCMMQFVFLAVNQKLKTLFSKPNVGWLCWGLTSQSTIFQSCRDGAIASWVINQYFRGVKCLAQGHNTAEVGLEPRTSRSGVRHSTTEPPIFCHLLTHSCLQWHKQKGYEI